MRGDGGARAWARSPMVQFLTVGLVLFLGLVLISDRLIDRAAETEALGDARRTTAVLAQVVAEQSLTDRLLTADPGTIDRFDREVRDALLVQDVRRVKIWRADGTIVYSDQTELIGRQFPLDADDREILREGGTDAEVSDLSEPENQFESDETALVEVYTRIETPGGTPLLFEVYYSAAQIEADTQSVFVPFRRIAVGSLIGLGALAVLIIWGLNRRVGAAAEERQRLLQAAIDASESERRRIARDLHDGVVQDLAGTTFALSAMARDPDRAPAETATDAAASLRRSLKSLRSLLVEIHPPDLDADGLAAALEDLVAPASTAGMSAHVEVEGVTGISDGVVALVWRVAQEGVRNALRHSRGTRLDVRVCREADRVSLEVADDGVGIDPERRRAPGHLGLRGLASLVEEAGGSLTVTGAPGEGTVLRLEVAT